MSDRCSTSLGSSNFRLWLGSEVRATSPVRPLHPREPTFERWLPLFDPFLPLYLQVRTILTVPPLDCGLPKQSFIRIGSKLTFGELKAKIIEPNRGVPTTPQLGFL